jgi:hypothetical protein
LIELHLIKLPQMLLLLKRPLLRRLPQMLLRKRPL